MFAWLRLTVLWGLCIAGLLAPGFILAAPAILNQNGGSSSTNGLKIYIDRYTQIQVQRLNSSGQLYRSTQTPQDVTYSDPSQNQLDNGIYIRGNNTIYGPDHFAYNAPGSYSPQAMTAVSPANASAGNAQTTRSQFTVPGNNAGGGPQVTIDWSYTYPYDFVTAKVSIYIPPLYPVSSTNPVRYYHVVDTYLGGSDCGCGVRYVDTNGKQVAGTYPYAGSCSSGSTNTNVKCPSSTSLPANLDVVESFRERDGKFSNYCVGNWQTFWSSSNSDACGIAKSNQLSNTVNTFLTDTGAAIEYDFTLPGTYTFSYDFVVGSTLVPDYDHLEIRHPGSSSLCPVDIQVMACLVSTMPCPDDQLINSGSLTGTLTISPSSPSVTVTPSNAFEVGNVGTKATLTLQGSAAATYTLGATGLSKGPMNGVKCWNTASGSQSCSFTMTNTPCVSTYECMESGMTYNNLSSNSSARNPIYTKILAQSFDLDVVALLSSGAQSSGYNSSGLKVDLVTDSSGSCSTNIIVTKDVSFSASDGGRKKVTFSATDVPKAYPNLRCQVRDPGQNKSGCSSDNFAIRPQSLAVTNTNTASSSSPSSTDSPVFRAGADNFSLTVSSGELGYNGTPKISNALLAAHAGAPVVGQVAGSFPAASSGSSTGTSFTYSEVGHFKISSQGLYDDTFTAVDQSKGDCDNTGSPFDNSGAGTPPKYGCRFGNTTDTNYFGRFIPNSLRVDASNPVTLACGSFVYYGQDTTASSAAPGFITPFSITALNAAGNTTQNYTGNYARLDLTNYSLYRFSASPSNGATLSASAATPAISKTTDNTAPVWGNGTTSVRVRHKLSRPSSAINQQSVVISAQPQDSDNVTSAQTALTSGGIAFRYGRLAVIPAHGSELLALPVPIEAQYYKDGFYVRSQGDACTTIDSKSIVMKNFKGNLSACETFMSGIYSANNGLVTAKLAAPKVGSDGRPNVGSVDLEVNLGNAVSGESTCQSNSGTVGAGNGDKLDWFGTTDPVGRASFGIYKAPIIYMRESFQ